MAEIVGNDGEGPVAKDLSESHESDENGDDLGPLLDSPYQLERHKDDQQLGYVCYYTPFSFHTSAQLLHLKNKDFLKLQTQFKSLLSLLIVQHDYKTLDQYSAVVGFTSEPQHLPIVFSSVDPIAQSALSAIMGNFSGFDRDILLLDRLDLAEYIGDCLVSPNVGTFTTSQQVVSLQSQGIMVDAAFSSLLYDACQVAKVAAHSIDSLFKYPGPVLIPSPSVLPNSIPVCNQLSVPIPFQRVCMLLQQHLYWIPTPELHSFQGVHGNKCRPQSFMCGPHNAVQCIGMSHVPLEDLLEWYQMTLAKRLLLHMEPTSDIWQLLRNILNSV